MIWDVGESAPEYALVRQVLLGAGSFGAMLSSLRCIPTAEGGQFSLLCFDSCHFPVSLVVVHCIFVVTVQCCNN
jgi:hypothetical protein